LSSLTEIHKSKDFAHGDKLGFHSTSTSQEYVYAIPTTERKGTWVGPTTQITYTGKGNNNSKDKVIPVHTLKENRRMRV